MDELDPVDTDISLGLDLDLEDEALAGLDAEAESKDPETAEQDSADVDAALLEAQEQDNSIDAMVGSLDEEDDLLESGVCCSLRRLPCCRSAILARCCDVQRHMQAGPHRPDHHAWRQRRCGRSGGGCQL